MSGDKKFRGILPDQEIDRNARRPDTRTLFQRLSADWRTTDGVIAFNAAAVFVAALTYSIPFSGEFIALVVFFFWRSYVNPKKERPWNFPYRAPIRGNIPDGSYPSSKDPKTGKRKYKRGDGITLFGKEFGSNLEIWAANSDLRTHNLVLGTTGSGKTELLLGLVFNALVQNSGVVYVDGKGDVALYDNVFRLARLLGREDDLLVLNFITAGRDLAGKSTDRVTNTINPYARSSSSMQNELNISLMDDGGGGGDMWKGRAIAFISALSRPLTWLRDRGYLLQDPGTFLSFFELPDIEKLVLDKRFIGIGGEEFTIKDPEFDEALKPLLAYLGTLPGYTKEKKGKQEQKTLEQHGFITMQLTRTFGDLTFTYGHIFRHKLGEIDFTDVVLNRRILIVLLPALERAPDSMKALGKLVVGNLKAMMGTSLGSSLEGYRREIIEARPTLAPVPFYDILDEYGYYAVVGFAVAPAQARSLAHSITFAAQDFSSLKKASAEEADATWENTNIRMVGRITSGEESETWKRIRGLAGEVEVDSFGQKEHRVGEVFDSYRTNRDTTTEKVGRIAFDDLAQQENGEFHFFIGKKSDAGKRGGVRVIRGRSFYTGQSRKDYHTEIRINHFLKVEPPATIETFDREKMAELVAEKLRSKQVAAEFGGSGGKGVKGGVATTFVASFVQLKELEGVPPLERAMAALAALSLRESQEHGAVGSGGPAAAPRQEAIEQINSGLTASVASSSPSDTPASEVSAELSDEPLGSETVEFGGMGGYGGENSAESLPEEHDSYPEEDAAPVPAGHEPHAPADSSDDDVASSASSTDGSDSMRHLLDGWETIFPASPDQIRDVVEAVEEHVVYEGDDGGPLPDVSDDDLVQEPSRVAEKVTQAIVQGNRYAEAPVPEEVGDASFDDLLQKLSEAADGASSMSNP